jgi:hypothetical protein
MKRGEVFIQVISEIAGCTISEIPGLDKILGQYIPEGQGFDEELTETEAERLLVELRKEQDGIRHWLGQGFFRALFRHADPMGIG